VLVTGGALALGQPWPIALLLGAIATATAPASTLMVIRECDSAGPLTDSLLGIIAVNNLLCMSLFGLVAATVDLTTNIGGLAWTDKWDHYTVTRDLDLASWDDYVGEGHVNPYKDGAMHDLIRGLKQKNFWVMEAQPGFVNWARVSNSLNRGEVRRMAWAAIGHGADAIAYWQWRSALNGQEQYHGVLLGPDGTPVPLYDEIRQIGREFAQASKSLEGTTPVSEVAILHSYDSRWAIDFQLHNKNYDQQGILLDYYRPLLNLAQSVDIVKPEAALAKYKLVVAPSLNMISDELGRHLLDYVRQGGHLVLGPRSGMKDEYNALDVRRQPGPLVDALGGRIEQFYALEKDVPVSGEWGKGKATIWAELASTKSPDTETVMRYGEANGWLDQQAAVITRRVGKGRITYIGAVLDSALMDSATQWMAKTSGVGPVFGAVPDGVEVCRRVGSDRQLFIVLNHTDHSVKVTLPRAMKSVLQENRELTEVELPVQGVEVLEERR
jgi:beta-galactosidase